MSLRSALLALALAAVAACGGPAQKSTLPVVGTQPGDDLARAQAGAQPGADGTDDPRLGTAGADTSEPKVTDLDTIRIDVVGRDASGEPELDAVAAADLLLQGQAAAKDRNLDVAINTWRRLVTELPDSKYAPTALWDIAAIEEKRGDTDAEIAALRELVTNYPKRREAVDAHLYIAALQAERERWAPAKATLDEVIGRVDLTYSDRVEALARKGYVLLELGDIPGADAALADAIATWRKAPRVADAYFIAMAHYYRGELAHRQFKQSPIRKDVATAALHDDLEAREKLAAAAYDRWKETLDFQHPYWSTAAGYQMSQIFVEFWQATVKAPYPTDLDVRARPQYVAEVHARVQDHLEKALEGHRMNVELGAAFQVQTVWATASKDRASELMVLLAQEATGHYVTPDP